MTTPTPPAVTAASPLTADGLDWLLQEFTGRVAGVTHAVLVSRDGLKMAVAGLDTAEADRAAAWMSSLHSLARSAGTLIGAPDGGFRQVVIEDAGFLVFVVSADFAAAARPSLKSGAGSGLVGCVLGVLAEPGADVGVVGYEIALLVKSVTEQLTTPTRGGRRTDGNR